MADSIRDLTFEFHDDKILDITRDMIVMMDWERPIMEESAKYVCQNGGDILEIGFGMGICSDYIQSESINSHTIIENHPEVYNRLSTWASSKSNVITLERDWFSALEDLGKYDGIFLDTYCDDNYKHFYDNLSKIAKTGTKVTFWNSKTSATNMFEQDMEYEEISITPDFNEYFTNNTYYMPKVTV
jgi:protein arginine N-methyltransferase 2